MRRRGTPLHSFVGYLMFDFDEDTVARRVGPSRWSVALTDRWNIGPNPNGGYVAAAMTSALTEASDKPDPLVVTAHYLRPSSVGDADVVVEVVRVGRRHTHLTARLVQGTERVRVLAVFGDLDQARGPTLVRRDPPSLPPPEDCMRRATAPESLARIPRMMAQFETRLSPAVGWVRGEPSGVPEVAGWIRFADGRPPDARSLPLFADAFPPPAFELAPGSWIPTIELTTHVLARPNPGWLRAHFASDVLMNGYVSEDGELWDDRGAVVARSRQLALYTPTTIL